MKLTRLSAIIPTMLLFTIVTASASDLSGLWHVRAYLGPEMHGRLVVRSLNQQLVAEISGQSFVVSENDGALDFATPEGHRFSGYRCGPAICGHWHSRRSRFDGNVFATPVMLSPMNDNQIYTGRVHPILDTATFHLLVSDRHGKLQADLINPERNLGTFQQLDEIILDDRDVTVMGRFRGRGEPRPMMAGILDDESDTLLINYRGRGGWYSFRRTDPEDAWGFLARNGSATSVAKPMALDDGWATASPTETGLDTGPIAEMIRDHILPQPQSHRDLSIHSVLIAHRGKLVVEEYFHGHHRDLPHDSRSAGKAVAAVLAAAAMHDGAELSWESPVYAQLNPAMLEQEPRRGNITLRNLANMDSGLDCDDRNPDSAANEDYLWDHADELDFYRHTLNVDLKHDPGKVPAYCSASANLVGAMVSSATGDSLLASFHRLLAKPLGITYYGMPVPPDGHPYMGGGIRLTPRDFLKFPQVMLNKGKWNGRAVISEEDAARMISPEVTIDGDRLYGYLWWTDDYDLGETTVRAHYMAGNGGQIAMLVPELDLAIAVNAGNYSHRVVFRIQHELIPNYLLRAVAGDRSRSNR